LKPVLATAKNRRKAQPLVAHEWKKRPTFANKISLFTRIFAALVK